MHGVAPCSPCCHPTPKQCVQIARDPLTAASLNHHTGCVNICFFRSNNRHAFRTGGPHGQQAPRRAHPWRCVSYLDPGHSVPNSRQSVPSNHRGKSFRGFGTQSTGGRPEPLASQRFVVSRKPFHRGRSQVQRCAFSYSKVPQGGRRTHAADFFEDPEHYRRGHRLAAGHAATQCRRRVELLLSRRPRSKRAG